MAVLRHSIESSNSARAKIVAETVRIPVRSMSEIGRMAAFRLVLNSTALLRAKEEKSDRSEKLTLRFRSFDPNVHIRLALIYSPTKLARAR